MVAARTRASHYPRRVYAYETLSETNWYAPGVTPAFQPNMFVDISGFLPQKLEAFGLYRSQVQTFPNESPVETLGELAMLRGANANREDAETFVLPREHT